MSFLELKLQVRPHKAGMYWSKTQNKQMYMDDNAYIVWESEDLTVTMERWSIKDTIEYIQTHPVSAKNQRTLLMRFDDERFPLKEKVGMDKWLGVIVVDLDLQHDPTISKYNDNQRRKLYVDIINALHSICPDNFAYIEHSSSGVGIHIMFYFDCEKSQDNFDKYAYFVYDVFKNKIDEYIEDFSHIFDTKGVFDPVYSRPYQKTYLTGIDAMVYDCSGDCSNINIEIPASNTIVEPDKDDNVEFNIKEIKLKKEYDVHYPDRFYIITALKKYVSDKAEAKKIWYKLCERFTLYDKYTTRIFKNEFDNLWDKVDASRGRIQVLKKYGIEIDTSYLNIWLKDNEYLSDVSKTILSSIGVGINLMVAPTGSGKTEIWKILAKEYEKDLLSQTKPMLIIEPMNSIVANKYDDKYYKAIGSKQVGKGNGTVITNYNHCVKKRGTEFMPLDEPDKFFEPYGLVVVDESHILLKDKFRSDVLVPFMETLNRCKTTKIVIQTGTTMFEKSCLNVNKTIEIHKKPKQNVKVIWREVEDNQFNIAQIICLTKYYIGNGRKTYIYWNNAPLDQLKFLQNMCEDKVSIYHKRASGSDDMNSIETEHKLGQTDIFASSVYFGVGNDLLDEVDQAAVIVIGNNTWEEDVQAIGRWRNAKDIEVCIVLRQSEMEEYNKTKDFIDDFTSLCKRNEWKLRQIWNDFRNRDKSIIIRGVSWTIKDEWYIDYLAKMAAAADYNTQTKVKIEQFEKLGYDVRDKIKPLLINIEWQEELKKHRKDLKDIKNKIIADALSGEIDWDKANRDPKTERGVKIIKRLYDNDLIKYCDLDKFVWSKIVRYEIFFRYWNMRRLDSDDLAELFSIMWTIDKIKSSSKNETREITIDNEVFVMNEIEYACFCGYIVWLRWRDNGKYKEQTQFFYYKQFRRTAIEMSKLEPRLVNRLFVKFGYDKEYIEFEKQFLGSKTEIEEVGREVKAIEDFLNYIEAVDNIENMHAQLKQVVELTRDDVKRGEVGGKIGSPKKKCVITEKIKESRTDQLKKYNLQIGQEFESASELAEYTGISKQKISGWRNKGWIE